MARLKIEKMPCTSSLETMRISGFSDGELSELKSMEHLEAKEALLDMLDRRHDGLGTVWLCGRGAYGLWFDNEFAYLNVGKSSD